jgi:hypothetical protein
VKPRAGSGEAGCAKSANELANAHALVSKIAVLETEVICLVPVLFRGKMATSTAIEWTDATWNPVTGCTKISAGCDNCYAERFSERFRGVPGHPFENGFDLQLRPERLEQPLRWREAKMIFVNSMSDLFHKEVPFKFIDRAFRAVD